MENNTTIKVFLTKRALTEGIKEVEARVYDISKDVAEVSNTIYGGLAWKEYYHGEGKDWHRTLESAKARAEIMRTKKIDTLKKQIDKLEKMKF